MTEVAAVGRPTSGYQVPPKRGRDGSESFAAVLRLILNAAVNADFLLRSPCRGIKRPSTRPTTRRIIESEEVHGLAEAVGDKYRAMVLVAAEFGLRWGECAGLQVRDLDLLHRTVTVQ